MQLLQILTGTGALTLAGIGLTMVRFDEYLAAYWLFGAAALVAIISGFWWEITTSDGIIVRTMSGTVAAVAVFMILPILIKWTSKREAEWRSKQPPTG